MADIDSASVSPAPPDPDKKASSTSFSRGFTAVVMAASLFAAGWKLGHDAGVSDGGLQFQSQISDLREKVTSATTAATISQSNEATVRALQKQWQDAYNKLLDTDKDLASENSKLKEELQQLDPCAFMEKEIVTLNATISAYTFESPGWNRYVSERDGIHAQLSTCRQARN